MKYEVTFRNPRSHTSSKMICVKADIIPSGHLAFEREDMPGTAWIESLSIVESIKELAD